MFVLSCSMKILALGFHELLKSIFCLLLIEEAFSLQKVVEVLQELVVSWWEVRWIWQMSQNFITQFIQLLKHWLWDRWLGIVMENWALSLTNASCRHYSFQWILSICWVYFYDIMISLGFRELQWIRLAADYQNSAHDLFFFFFLALGSALELLLSPTTELVVTGCQLKFTFHCTSKSDREIVHWYCMIREDISKRLFLFFVQLMRHLLIAFSPLPFTSNAERP